jgi:hypothetical protein
MLTTSLGWLEARPVFHRTGQQHLARYECLECGQVGPAADRRLHAESGACTNFRVITTVSSAHGKLLDERVEVCQI